MFVSMVVPLCTLVCNVFIFPAIEKALIVITYHTIMTPAMVFVHFQYLFK